MNAPNDIDKTIEALDHLDGFSNLISLIGSKDKTKGNQITRDARMTRFGLEDMYIGDPIARRIVDVPAQDMIRKWWQLDIPEMGEEKDDVIRRVQAKMRRLKARKELKKGIKWARLYGKAITIIGVKARSEGEDDTRLELERGQIEDVMWLKSMHRHQFTPGPPIEDPASEWFGDPKWFEFVPEVGSNGVPRRFHRSRVLIWDGLDLPDDIKSDVEFTGQPVLESVRELLGDYQGASKALAIIAQEFSVTMYKIQGYRQIIAAGKEKEIQTRMLMQDIAKSVANCMLLDSEGEDVARLTASIVGLPDSVDRLMLRLSAATGMPMTLLFGMAPKGFANEDKTGEANWDDTVSADQEDFLLPNLDQLIGLILASSEGPTGGAVPESWVVEFNPLSQPTELEISEAREKMAKADDVYLSHNVLDRSEVASSRFGPDGYGTDVSLDPGIDRDSINNAPSEQGGPAEPFDD